MNTSLHQTAFYLRTALLATLLVLLSISAAPVIGQAAQGGQNPIRTAAPGEGNPAADTDTAKRMAARAAIKSGATPIVVQHEGTDSLGGKLAYQLKEIFNSGTIFALNDKDEPKLQMIISTVSEFSTRPGVGSVYCVVWAYSERPTTLSSYLAQEVGIVTPDNLADLADTLAARTSGLAAKHSYIFNN